MAQTACEMVWLRSFLSELEFSMRTPMAMHCDNQVAIFIANNPAFHERTKHIEVDCHYVHNLVMKGVICTPYTQSTEQLANIFIKGLSVEVFESLYNKLCMINIYTLICGKVLALCYIDYVLYGYFVI